MQEHAVSCVTKEEHHRIMVMEDEDNLTRLASVPKVYGELKKLCRKDI